MDEITLTCGGPHGEDPGSREITLSPPGRGYCDCCRHERDITELETAVAGQITGTAAVCGWCIASALAVRFAVAAAENPRQNPGARP